MNQACLPIRIPLAAAEAGAASWRLRAGVIIAGFCTFLQVYTTQPLLPVFRAIFSATELQATMTVGAVSAAVALAAPIVGLLADAIGRKRIIVPALLAMTVPTMLAATAGSLGQLIFWRFAQGLCIPGIIAVVLAYIAEEAPAGTAGSVTASYVAGTILGGLMGRFLAALVADRFGWQAAFLALGGVSLAGGIAASLLLPAARRFVPRADTGAMIGAMRCHLRNPRLLATYAVGFNGLFTLLGSFSYINFHLAGDPFHLSTVALGSVVFVYALGVVITPIAGSWIDRVGFRNSLLAAVCITITGALLTLSPVLWVVIVGMAVLSTGMFISQATGSSHIGVATHVARSAAAGLYVSFYYLGGFAGATVLGVVWHYAAWPGCVATVVGLQCISATIGWRYFTGRTRFGAMQNRGTQAEPA